MNIIDRFKYALTGRLPNNGVATITSLNGQLINNFQNPNDYVRNGYSANAVIYSIISFSARKFSSVPVFLYQVEDETAFKRYKALTGNGFPTTKHGMREALKLQKKALNAVDKHPIIDLLKRPNPLQGGGSFFENLYGFKLITGAGTAWANRGGDDNGEPVELWCLPSQDILIVCDRKDYLMPAGYQLRNGYVSNLRKEDVLYWKYWNPNWSSSGSHLYGFAPMKAGYMIANERSKADKTSAITMQNQGSKGVVYSKDPKGMSIEQRDRLQDRIDEEVNGIENAGRISVANSDMGYLDLGRSNGDLGMIDTKRMTKEDLCNVWGMPPVILDPSKGTLANLEASIKSFVTNKIIPEWCSLRDDLNPWLLPMYKNSRGLWIEPDFSALPEMQEDLEKQVNAVMKIWPLTPNQMLDFLGWEGDANSPEMNKRYIPSNLIPMDQVNAVAGDINADVEKLVKLGLNDYK